MTDQNQITKMSDNTLLDEVKILVRREKEIVVEVIEYLKEIELRKLHLARGYSSMFAFATDFLGYSEAEAHIRIQAARLTQALPEVKALIETGEMSLSVAAAAQSHFRKENSRRKEQGKPILNLQEKREAIKLVKDSSRRKAEHSLNIHFAQRSTKTMSFEISEELAQKIEKLMDLMAHKNFDRDLGKMIEILVDQELAKYEKRTSLAKNNNEKSKVEPSQAPDFPRQEECKNLRTEKHINPQNESQFTPALKKSRYIPQKTKSLVWAKYQAKCTFKDPTTGKTCESKHGIQIDHNYPFSKGGSTDLQNLTLLCASHNQWKGDRLLARGSLCRQPPSPP